LTFEIVPTNLASAPMIALLLSISLSLEFLLRPTGRHPDKFTALLRALCAQY